MTSSNTDQYTIEELQEVYALSIQKEAELIERFHGDRLSIDKVMKRFAHRTDQNEP